jgi:MFS family permease
MILYKYTRIIIFQNSNRTNIKKVSTMSNFLSRLNIDMEKKTFSFLLVFMIIFFGIDIVSVLLTTPSGIWVVFLYGIPLILTLIIAGVVIDKLAKRTWFLLLLIPEGLLTLVLGISITDPTANTILWIFLGIFSGFTIAALLGFFADMTKQDQRGKVAGLVCGLSFLVAAILLSWISSTVFAANVLMYLFAIIKLAGGGISFYLLIRKPESGGEAPTKFQGTGQGFLGYLKQAYSFIWTDKKFRIYFIAFALIWVAQGIYAPIGGFGQVSPPNFQQIASIGFAAGALFLIMMGSVVDQHGRKQMLLYGTILAILSFLSSYFPLGAVFLAGLPLLIAIILVFLGDIAPSDGKARYYSIFLMINLLGFLIGVIIGLAIGVGSVGVVVACIIITAIALVLILLKGEESLEISGFKASEPTSPAPTTVSENPSPAPTTVSEQP